LPSLFLGSSLIIYVSCKIISNDSASDDASKDKDSAPCGDNVENAARHQYSGDAQ
jgi:hypothetical protein